MPIKAQVESLEGLSEELKALYVEKDGKFVLDVAPVGGLTLENVDGLKTALGKERKALADAKASLERFGDLDPEKARGAMTKVAEMANWTPEEKVKETIEAQKKQIVEKAQADIAAANKAKDGYYGQLQRLMVENAAMEALTKHGATSAKILMPHVQSRVRLRQGEGDQLFVEVLDEKGNPAIGDSNGNPMTIDQLVSGFKASDEFGVLFKGTEQRGSGGGGSSNGGGGSRPGTYTIADLDAGRVDIAKVASGELTLAE